MEETNECNIYTCAICLDVIPDNDFFETECRHIFHNSCIDNWLKNKNSCPCCRYILNDNDYSELTAEEMNIMYNMIIAERLLQYASVRVELSGYTDPDRESNNFTFVERSTQIQRHTSVNIEEEIRIYTNGGVD